MTVDALAEIRRRALGALRPPEKLPLSEWVEGNVRLPSSIAATPGAIRLWPYQRAIADSIGDPAVERVSVLKSARIGYTQLLVAALGHYAINDPGPVLVVLPADADCRHLMTGAIEPTFGESPALRNALLADTSGRDTMLSRFFPGGSLAIVSANAPRNLRARTARVLFLDEVDGFEVDARGEGDPVALAEKRTLSYGNRKIVLGSTPVDEETSRVCRAYDQSDQRVYECPCPHCGDFHEIRWADIRWETDRPETAAWVCPSCGCVTEESGKPAMVKAGGWRATRPEIEGHHGYKVNALVSLLPNAAWSKLAAEFLEAKRNPTTLKAFTTTLLAEPWKAAGEDLAHDAFDSLTAPMSAAELPAEVLWLTAGVDCQADRLEASLVGWTRDGELRVLEHSVIWGSPLEKPTWIDLDSWLTRQFQHPLGGLIYIDAAIVDSGNWADQIYDFCRPRTSRRVIAGKGMSGFSRPALAWGQSRKTRLAQIGVDSIKLELHERIKDGRTVLFSDDLGPDYFDQLRAERLVTKYTRGHPARHWELISGRRNEALDTLTYATAARQLLASDAENRKESLKSKHPLPCQKSISRSKFLENLL
ncbi:terminase gpA endonuclease subunit [uncultured Roseovarius sp.]|uniref:phage terminase large subunit family protein n=1 Tax=uncultured Roseovarius sp. TaxID=293344 RepID=UPI002597BF8D|nr:terminase gpA endonuclease subunit [uncultured Roseovarius sp.]